MSFDATVAVWCVVTPAAIVLVAAAIARRVARRRGGESSGDVAGVPETHRTEAAAGTLIAAGWWLAVTISVAGRRGLDGWPEDAWQRTLWPILAFGVWLAASRTGVAGPSSPGSDSANGSDFPNHGGRWVGAAVLASLLGAVAMPGGDGWADAIPLHRYWLPAVLAAALVNAWVIDRLAGTGGDRWGLWVVVAALAAPVMLAAGTYGALAEWGIAAIFATLGLAVWQSIRPHVSMTAAAYPAIATSAALAASGHFYSFEEYPRWLTGLILFLPVIVVAVDRAVRGRPGWVRVIVAGIVAASIVAVVGWKLFLSEPEPEW